jgi:hypothetical protein
MSEGFAPPAAGPASLSPASAEARTYRIHSIEHPTAWIADRFAAGSATKVPHGRLPGLLPRLCPELTDREVFIAGAPGFVRACAAAAETLGAAPELVRTELFFVEPWFEEGAMRVRNRREPTQKDHETPQPATQERFHHVQASVTPRL